MKVQRLHSLVLTFGLSLTLSLPMPLYAIPEKAPDRIPMEDVQRFSNAISLIKKYYVRSVTDQEVFDNAIRGMVSSLDPHSGYLDESEYKELQTSTSGEFGGLGLEVTMEKDVVKVVTPLVDTPAYKAGLKSGDYIIKLGTHPVQGLSLKEAVELMRGKEGSMIDLTVLRKGETKPLVFKVMREKIVVKSIKSELLDGQYGYIRISQFQALTGADMEKAIAALKKEAKGGVLKGLILDLRNNPGGLLDSAIQVSDSFLDFNKNNTRETIVYTQGRFPGSKFTAYANPGDLLNKAPMIVLINNGSASASEIVAGALKDNKRAIIVGTRSFGKGSVQTVLPLDDKRGLKLTTALYYTPSGISIQAKGITPDIVIDELQIPKKDANGANAGFSEADLSGHIANVSQAEGGKMVDQSDEALLHKDYQLYAALSILKGLAVAQQ